MKQKSKLRWLVLCLLFLSVQWAYSQSLPLSAVVSAGGSNQTFSYSLGQVVASDGNGGDRLISTGIHQVEIDFFLAVDVPFKKESLKLFPNPTEKLLFISSQADYFDKLTFELIDALGKRIETTILESGIQQKSLDCSQLQSGVYILTVRLDDSYSESFRIIKN